MLAARKRGSTAPGKVARKSVWVCVHASDFSIVISVCETGGIDIYVYARSIRSCADEVFAVFEID